MNEKQVKRWYAKHGMKYVNEDWGQRAETGEGLENDRSVTKEQHDPRRDKVMLFDFTPGTVAFFEESGYAYRPIWHERSVEDTARMEALEDFFEPYIAMLPRAKGNLILEYYRGRTQKELAEAAGVRQPTISVNLRRAIERLVRLIAADAPDADVVLDGLTTYAEAAGRVLDRYWKRRFGKPYLSPES